MLFMCILFGQDVFSCKKSFYLRHVSSNYLELTFNMWPFNCVCVCVSVRERWRQRQKDRDSEGDTDQDRQRQRNHSSFNSLESLARVPLNLK